MLLILQLKDCKILLWSRLTCLVLDSFGFLLIVYFIVSLLSNVLRLLVLNPYLKFLLRSSLRKFISFMPVYFLKLSANAYLLNTPRTFCHFAPISADEVFKSISLSADAFYDLDPIPAFLLKYHLFYLLWLNLLSYLSPLESFLINSKSMLFFIFSNSLISAKKTPMTTGLHLLSPF
jgi:hypothetical protein